MNYLLDTHVLIWYIEGNLSLSKHAKTSIETPNIINYVSIASLWEMAIKVNSGKLALETPFSEIYRLLVINLFEILPITFEDIVSLSTLPFHHRDPFDRMIISQSITNNLTLISKDKEFKNYPINILW